ncbi:MAG TPA: hypothetical protein PLI01_00415 [Nitrospira sp.]|nr:hypothetical protein [Nitrospira sp.]HNA25222.1 hypothetical protein [Nitrospira sp.]HNI17512.1 hypothetical protein [Nitrospira sp.]
MDTLKQSLKESIAKDHARQLSGIVVPWTREEFKKKKTPHGLYATILLKDGSRATVSAKRQRDILEAYGENAAMVLECLCDF